MLLLQVKNSLPVMSTAFTRGLHLVSYTSLMQLFHYLGRDLAAMPILITDYFVLHCTTIGFLFVSTFVYCCETEARGIGPSVLFQHFIYILSPLKQFLSAICS